MDKAAEAFWWPGLYRQLREKAEKGAGKNHKTRIPLTEVNRLELLTEKSNQISLGKIKTKTRGYVYILEAINRFSNWSTAQICNNSDTRAVLNFLTKYCPHNLTPRTIYRKS